MLLYRYMHPLRVIPLFSKNNPQLDRSHTLKSNSMISGCFNSFLRHSNICDIWRLQNDGARDYTLFSARHKSYSRIDYLLVSPSLIPYIRYFNILQILYLIILQ